MKTRNAIYGGLILTALLLSADLAEAQLTGASSATLGTANNYTALARNFGAIGVNPAGLGMPGTGGFSLAFLPIQARQGLDPVTLKDLADYGGTLVPASVKEQWLQEIADAGGETGGLGAAITPFSFNAGRVGFQLTTLVGASATLNEDAAELLAYGNAGRTGQPGDFALGGSHFSGFGVSTLGVSFGLPLDFKLGAREDQAFAVGATLKYSMGHVLAVGEDAGSLTKSSPIEVAVKFPVIHVDTDDMGPNQGSGFGLDFGMAWEGGPWSMGVAVQNLFNTFAWDMEGMVYRPGEALFNQDNTDSDFDTRPVSQAPAGLRDQVEAMTFDPSVAFGAAYDISEDLTVSMDVGNRFGDGMDVGPKFHAGAGFEFRGVPFLPLRAGFSKITDGFQMGGGLELVLGPVHLGGATLIQTGDAGSGTVGMFTLSFGGS